MKKYIFLFFLSSFLSLLNLTYNFSNISNLSAQSAQEESVFSLNSFTGGLNTKTNSLSLSKDETPDCQNVILDENGTIQKRKGFTLWSTLPSTGVVLGGAEYTRSSGERWMVVQIADKIYASKDGGLNWIQIKSGLSEINPINYTTYQDDVWMANGFDVVFTFNGSTTTNYGNIPKGKYITTHFDQIFVANVLGEPSRVYFSDTYYGPKVSAGWQGYNAFILGQDDGDIITGIASHKGNIVVFKTNSTWGILGYGRNMDLIRYNGIYGCVSQRSVQEYKNDLIFLSKQGLCAFGNGLIKQIDKPIESITKSANVTIGTAISKSWLQSGQKELEKGTINNLASAGLHRDTLTIIKTIEDIDFDGATKSENIVKESGGLQFQKKSDVVFTEAIFKYRGDTQQVGSDVDAGIESNMRDGNWDTLYEYGKRDYVNTGFGGATLSAKGEIRYRFTIGGNKYVHSIKIKGGTDTTGSTAEHFTYAQIEVYIKKAGSLKRERFYITRLGEGGKVVVTTPEISVNLFLDEIEITISGRGVRYVSPFGQGTVFGTSIVYEISLSSSNVYVTTGTFVSKEYDTGCNENNYIWGYFDAKHTIPSQTSLEYLIRTYDVAGDTTTIFQSLGTFTSGGSAYVLPSIQRKRFYQYAIKFNSTDHLITPIVKSITQNFQTTGYYNSQKFNAGVNICKWRHFIVLDTNNGIQYKIRTATSSANLDTASWTSINSGDLINKPTNQYWIQWRADFNNPAQILYSVTINWMEGDSDYQDVASAVRNDRYYIAFTTSGFTNNNVVVLDNNLRFTKFDGINASAFLKYGDNFLFTSATDNKIYKLETSNNDNNLAINAFWESKDLDFGTSGIDKRGIAADIDKRINKIGITAKGTGDLIVGYKSTYDTSYSTFPLTLTENFDNWVTNIPLTSAQKYWRIRIENNQLGSDFSVQKINLYYIAETLIAR